MSVDVDGAGAPDVSFSEALQLLLAAHERELEEALGGASDSQAPASPASRPGLPPARNSVDRGSMASVDSVAPAVQVRPRDSLVGMHQEPVVPQGAMAANTSQRDRGEGGLRFGDCSGETIDDEVEAPNLIVARWIRLISRLREGRTVKNAVREYTIRDCWVHKHDRRQNASYGGLTDPLVASMRMTVTQRGIYKSHARGEFVWDQLVRPNSAVRLIWSTIGFLLLVWDCMTLPLQAVDMDGCKAVIDAAARWTLVYWFMDVPMQSTLGFMRVEGVLERRKRQVWKHYLRTWFFVDVTVVLLDALAVVLADAGLFASSSMQNAKATRFLRVLRFVRLVRVARLGKLYASTIERFGSPALLLVASFGKYAAIVIVISHYVACGWFGIANYSNHEEVTWMSNSGLDDGSSIYKYIVSLHWSVTQFAPSTQNVAPANLQERAYAVLTTLLAMLTFSSVISSVTNAVNQIRTVNMAVYVEQDKVREFLYTRGVSTALFARIQTFFRRYYADRIRKINEKDVEFFHMLPESMLLEMHIEVYMPRLRASPVFYYFEDYDVAFLKRVCHQAFEERLYYVGQDLFMEGDASIGMYWCVSGRVIYDYHADQSRDDPVYSATFMCGDDSQLQNDVVAMLSKKQSKRSKVPNRTWFAELSLWLEWAHGGRSFSVDRSDVLLVKSSTITHLALDFCAQPLWDRFRTLSILVAAACEAAEERHDQLTDMPIPAEDWMELCTRSDKFNLLRSRSSLDGEGNGNAQNFGTFIGGIVRNNYLRLTKPGWKRASTATTASEVSSRRVSVREVIKRFLIFDDGDDADEPSGAAGGHRLSLAFSTEDKPARDSQAGVASAGFEHSDTASVSTAGGQGPSLKPAANGIAAPGAKKASITLVDSGESPLVEEITSDAGAVDEEMKI